VGPYCFAVTAIISGYGVACLVFPGLKQRGFLEVASDIGQCEVFFFASANEMASFWRGLYELENISEEEFFQSVDRAFPKSYFPPRSSFSPI